MSASIDITESVTLAGVRGFLASLVASGIEIVQGQDNLVPPPVGATYLEITPIMRRRLAWNTETYSDAPPASIRAMQQPTEYTVQCDVHGDGASDTAQMIATAWRDRYATEFFAALTVTTYINASGLPVPGPGNGIVTVTAPFNGAPLYANDPRQSPFITAEAAYERRWTVDLLMQVNPTVILAQQFAAALVIGLIEVDAVYPPPPDTAPLGSFILGTNVLA